MREFYFGVPPSRDPMWLAEMDSMAEYCVGFGLDPGAGGRTFSHDTLCADVRPDTQPQVLADAAWLPFHDGSFDYVCNSHLIEHLLRPFDAICEWLRVVRPGGHVCMVVPDTRFTNAQNTDPTPHRNEWAPREFLRQVCGWDDPALPWWSARGPLRGMQPPMAEIVKATTAAPQWSFMVALRKAA